MYVSRKKIEEMLKQAPAGYTPQEIIKEMVNRGYIIEGLNDQRADKKSVVDKFSSISGKFLDAGATLTGAKSAVELVAPIAQAGYVGSQKSFEKITGSKIGAGISKRILEGQPIGQLTQKAETEGLGAAIKDIAGKSLEVAASIAPFSKAAAITFKSAKMPKLARYLGYGTTGAVYGGTFSTSRAMQENKEILPELVRGVTTGAILGMAIPAVIEGSVRAIKNVVALYSGVPKKALENAFANPEKVRQAVHKYAKNPEQQKEVLINAENAMRQIKMERGQAYERALAQIPDTIPDQGVKNKLNQSLAKFSTKTLVKSEQNTVKELNKLISTWDDYSAKGVNELKQAIRNRITTGNSAYLNKILKTAERDLLTHIEKVSPKIAEMNANYADASKFIDNLQSEIFGKTSLMKDSTKLNRLMSVFSEKGALKHELVQQLGEKAGVDLLNELTGTVMTSWLPTGWIQRFVLGGGLAAGVYGGIGIPKLAGAIVVASPRVVGKGARVLGQVSRIAPSVGRVALPYGLKAIEKLKKEDR